MLAMVTVLKSRYVVALAAFGAALLFHPEDEVLGRNVSILMPSPHHEQHDAYLPRYLTTSEARIIGIGREVTGRLCGTGMV
jgi:hypothetical protein